MTQMIKVKYLIFSFNNCFSRYCWFREYRWSGYSAISIRSCCYFLDDSTGLLGMSTKFVECTLGVKYRVIDENGEVSGGPMYYLRDGLSKFNLSFRKRVGSSFLILKCWRFFGGGNMFQLNQTVDAQLQVSSLSYLDMDQFLV